MRVKKINKIMYIENDNYYNLGSLNRLMDNGTIDGTDEGFMSGYLDD